MYLTMNVSLATPTAKLPWLYLIIKVRIPSLRSKEGMGMGMGMPNENCDSYTLLYSSQRVVLMPLVIGNCPCFTNICKAAVAPRRNNHPGNIKTRSVPTDT